MVQPSTKNSVKYYFSLIIISLISVLAPSSEAKTVLWSTEPHTHFSKEEPLKKLLEAVAADQNIPIKVSDKITDIISVYFKNESPKSIIEELKVAYGLITFYDGSILYIYKGTETQVASARLRRGSILALEHQLKKENLLEPDMKWELSEENNQVNFSGTKRFIDIVLQKARSLDNENNKKIFKCTIKGKIIYSSSPPRYELCEETKTYRYNPSIEKENSQPKPNIAPTRPLDHSESLVELENE